MRHTAKSTESTRQRLQRVLSPDRLLDAAKRVRHVRADGFSFAYESMVRFFSGVDRIDADMLTVVAQAAYGWMPTMLELRGTHGITERFGTALDAAATAHQGHDISVAHVEALASTVNNSVVGASKVLHLLSPSRYPIWDRVVARYLLQESAYKFIRCAAVYVEYVEVAREAVQNEEGFRSVRAEIAPKLPYRASDLRLLEQVCFLPKD